MIAHVGAPINLATRHEKELCTDITCTNAGNTGDLFPRPFNHSTRNALQTLESRDSYTKRLKPGVFLFTNGPNVMAKTSFGQPAMYNAKGTWTADWDLRTLFPSMPGLHSCPLPIIGSEMRTPLKTGCTVEERGNHGTSIVTINLR